ncbi:hypothetical protein A3D62_00720 [Candidatus Kaiserbacteria bacterium RIFCSPHIGHO2_02_FULL_49_11]|uniref:Uncharacterized protein n=1 Tax=Candidatus Kaiserbacteria bacterium RIFCSPHIGHO2_02_FULL_49_11 TaxID=1798489 RepID=A0A1F6D0Z8_9BACT|nr:MAG: hypothetical protein A3D62_00720 [Candidatus Kaiserbacteria bacterium RIFCSPHIGHO2_02_FULL_49_11]
MSRTVSHKLYYGIEKQLSVALIVACLSLFSLYVYFVGKSIVNVVVREEIELGIAKINSHLSDLEREYLAAKDGINLNLAYSYGFQAAPKKKFVNRGTSSNGISLISSQ